MTAIRPQDTRAVGRVGAIFAQGNQVALEPLRFITSALPLQPLLAHAQLRKGGSETLVYWDRMHKSASTHLNFGLDW